MTDRRRARVSPSLLVLLAAALAVALAATSCRRARDGYGGTAVLALLREPESLNPLVDREFPGGIGALLFNGLTSVDPELGPVPDLAESWTVSADGLEWTFRLRKGIRFHDGTELTARDVVFSIRSFADPAISPRVSQLFAPVRSVEAVSDLEVRVTLRSPYAPVLYLLTVEVLPAHLLEGGGSSAAAFGRNPVGTGPFKLRQWKDGELDLEAFGQHFAGRPHLDSVVFRTFADRAKAWAELMRGTVDLVPDLEAADYAVIRGDARFQVREVPESFYYTLLLNSQDPLLRDPAVREAVDLAVDRRDIVDDTLGGFARETTGPFVPGTWAYDPALASSRYDPERSRALFASAGWTDSDGDGVLDRAGKQLELGMLVDRGDTLKVDVAQRIKWQLFQAGVKATVEFLDMGDLIQRRLQPGSYQTALLQFNAAGDPDTFLYLFWHSSRIGSSNLARYSSAAVDRLIEAGRVEADVAKRVDVYRSIHREIARDRPAVFLFVPRRLVGLSSRLEGVGTTSASLYSSVRTWRIGSRSAERR